MNVPFKVGDWVICGCGSVGCEPFLVTEVRSWGDNNQILVCGEAFAYVLPDDYRLRHCTPLEKLL